MSRCDKLIQNSTLTKTVNAVGFFFFWDNISGLTNPVYPLDNYCERQILTWIYLSQKIRLKSHE